jgi:hypothetical protein
MERRKKIYEPITPEERQNLLHNYLPFLSRGKFVKSLRATRSACPTWRPN